MWCDDDDDDDVCAADSVRVMLHVDDDSLDADYVNTEEGADYINASYVNVCQHCET